MDGVLNNINDDDEINVEGYALEIAACFPFEDPAACRDIYRQIGVHLDESLSSRAARHASKSGRSS